MKQVQNPKNPPMTVLGKKEVKEQVIQATIIAATTGLVNWALETVKNRAAKKAEEEQE